MKPSTKGALLSALVYPGIGQMSLKSYKRGLALIISVTAALALIINQIIKQATTVLHNIQLSGNSINIDTISAAATNAASGNSSNGLLTLFITIAWIAGIVDAYITGKQQEKRG